MKALFIIKNWRGGIMIKGGGDVETGCTSSPLWVQDLREHGT